MRKENYTEVRSIIEQVIEAHKDRCNLSPYAVSILVMTKLEKKFRFVHKEVTDRQELSWLQMMETEGR